MSPKFEVGSFCLVCLERKTAVTFHPAAPLLGNNVCLTNVNKSSLNKSRKAFRGGGDTGTTATPV